jgi:hypothetical protein
VNFLAFRIRRLAATGSTELPVTLTVYDVCTLDTGASQPAVASSAGGQHRIDTGEYFTSFRVVERRNRVLKAALCARR